MATITPEKTGSAASSYPRTRIERERITYAEYIERERYSEIKHNYVDGIMEPVWGTVAGVMPGATYEHNVICKNLTVLFANALEDTECQPLGSDMRIEVSSRSRYYYPDLTILCGDPMVGPDECLQNPILIVEVLSESTSNNDRGDKSVHYRAMPSLQHYVLVDQYKPFVQHYERQNDGKWLVAGEYLSLSDTWQFTLSSLEVALPLAKIYRRVPFPTVEELAPERNL